MKTNPDKELEEIVDKLMNETSLEKPSPDFTAKVMFQVYAANTGTATVYKPLISKRTWFVIFAIILVLLVFIISKGNAQSGTWLNLINIGEINNKIINSYTGFKFSAITIYSVVLSTIMLLIQIIFLKYNFNKRFQS